MTSSSLAGALDALVFDVGGVIVAHDNDAMYRQIAGRCTASPSPQAVKEHIRRTQWSLGGAPMSDLHRQLQAAFGYAGDWPEFVDDWTCHFTVDASMMGLVARLARSQRVILFSNTNDVHARYVGAQMTLLAGLERYLSCELGLAKPSPQAFLKVAELARIDPRRSLFVDDAPDNVRGAREAGFQGLLFQGEAELRKALAQAGVAAA